MSSSLVNPARPLIDPQPAAGEPSPVVDDVTRLNAQVVERVFCVRTAEDIQRVVRLARERNIQISCRGTQHTMGGQTIAPEGYVIDCRNLRQLSYDPVSRICVTGPGNTWADVIKLLNEHGCSPRTMQSYSTFSVGGSIAVGAHGITTDVPVSESILWCKLVDADGNIQELKQDDELMRHVLGGYGLFGIIFEVGMKVDDNVPLCMDMLHTDLPSFMEIYEAAAQDPLVIIKLARLDITDPDKLCLFVFRRGCIEGMRTVSRLPAKPREMGTKSRLMYKWLAPSLRPLRSALEDLSGGALDWSDAEERNTLMYESAQPMAELYSPILDVDDSFVLQEFFVPKSNMRAWVDRAKPVFAKAVSSERVALLNTTIRLVDPDTWSALPYSNAAETCVAFVLYYRIERNEGADAELQTLHSEFTDLTLGLGGRFYLPYRHHYSEAQLLKAYPEFPGWVSAKQRYDPECVFSNEWFERYGKPFWPAGAAKPMPRGDRAARDDSAGMAAFEAERKPWGGLERVSDRRSHSVQRVVESPLAWRAFRDEFLVNIFNLEESVLLAAQVQQAAMRARMQRGGDQLAYEHLQRLLGAGGSGSMMTAAGKAWRGLKQAHAQRRELLRQTYNIMSKLGRLGAMDGLVCIGDPGKLVLELQGVCKVAGKAWVVNDHDSDAAIHKSVADVVTRRSAGPVGEFVPFSYAEPAVAAVIPDESVDVVTMNQGLHHLPQAKLLGFLSDVKRVLRPGGLFLVREHNATEGLVPMCDIAHWVFNCVTGVSAADEQGEIRAFRPILEWRAVLRGAGFMDTMLYEVEAGDPTQDEMMCFYKPPFFHASSRLPSSPPELSRQISKSKLGSQLPSGREAGLPKRVQAWLDAIPVGVYEGATGTLESLVSWLPLLEREARSKTAVLPPQQRLLAQRALSSTVPLLSRIASEVLGMLKKAHVKQGADLISLPLDEIFVALELFSTRDVSYVEPDSVEYKAIVAAKMLWSYLNEDSGAQDSASAKAETAPPLTRMPSNLSHGKKRGLPEVSALVDRLVAARPDLLDPELIKRAGLSKHVATLMGSDREGVNTTLYQFLDGEAFEMAEQAVQKIEKGVQQVGAAEHARQYPVHVQVLARGVEGREGSRHNPWWELTMAVLGAPDVKFNAMGQRMARFAGLKCVIDAWETAQHQRFAQTAKAATPFGAVQHPGGADEVTQQCMELAARIATQADVPRSIAVSAPPVESYEVRVDDVKHVDYAFLRAAPTHGQGPPVVVAVCTQLVQELMLSPMHPHDTTGPKRLQVTRARVQGLLVELGLPTEGKKQKQRRGYRFGDITRGVLRTAGGIIRHIVMDEELYDAETLKLEVSYTVCETKSKSSIASDLSRLLLSNRMVSDRALDGGEYTWFKLNEWMQVELLANFADSLKTEPWYRYPIASTMATYFQVLFEEVQIVYAKLGPQKALASMAFLTDMVPGIVMSIVMAQLAGLAAPLRAYADAGFDAYSEETLTEELVVVVEGGPGRVEWRRVDARIRDVRGLSQNLCAMTVPTFLPLTEVLMKLASTHVEGKYITLVTISNQTEVQVKVSVPVEGDQGLGSQQLLEQVDLQQGCAVKFKYAFPTESNKTLNAAVEVQVPHLLDFLRFVSNSNSGLSIVQVYDFYGGE